jgi:uncharacterized membrane protein
VKVNTRRVVLVAIIAALYASMTLAIAPISYGVIQFRVSEILKVLVLFDPWLVFGIGIGTFFANLASPFAGPWDLIWMPLTDMMGGVAAWALFRFIMRQRYAWVASLFYAITTGAAVGLMLHAFGLGGFWILAATITVSEAIILVAGTPLILWIEGILESQNVGIRR